MAEAASQLDLQVLAEQDETTKLVPSERKKPFTKRRSLQIYTIAILVGVIATFVQWLSQGISSSYYPPFLMVIILFLAWRREKVKDIYLLGDKSIKIPYTWLYHRSISYEKVIRIIDDKITDEQSGNEYGAIRIIVDTALIKLNITGLQSPNILLTTQKFDSIDINRFADEVMKRKRDFAGSPNTLAQRLTDQVQRAWGNRWKLVFLNVLDSTTEMVFYLLIADSLLYGIFGVSMWPILGGILTGLYLIVVFLIQFFNKPQAIIGIRPHELGPLLYDEEELVTSVRFIVICQPYTVNLRDCEIIYPEDATRQVGRLNQIQPSEVEPGELVYGIAQFVGNHSKATGAKIQFTYKETENARDVLYEIPISWA